MTKLEQLIQLLQGECLGILVLPGGDRFIVLHKHAESTPQPYVTHEMRLHDDGREPWHEAYWGHYHETLEKARAEFLDRCRKVLP